MEKWERHEGNERRVREKKDTGVRGLVRGRSTEISLILGN
jgi:hypothetical protein